MLSRYYLLALLVVAAMDAHADVLKLTILQKGTGDPVADAVVADLKTNNAETSDGKGVVEFADIALPATIKIIRSGFVTAELTINNASVGEILLEPISNDDNVLEISAERVEEKTSKVQLQVEEMRKMPGTQGDPLKAVQSLPGVVTAVEGTGVMYIRGSEPNQNLVWANRARLGYLYHFGGLHSTISPQLVKDFNMFLGGFPVEYGDALGGALDVKLRSPRKDRLHQSYSYGTYESSAVLEGPIGSADGKDGFFLSGRRSYIDAVLKPSQFSKIMNAGNPDSTDAITQVPKFHDIQAIWQHDFEKGKASLQYFQAGDSISIDLDSSASKDPMLSGELVSSSGFRSTSLVVDYQLTPNLYGVSSLYLLQMESKLSLGKNANGEPFFMAISEDDYVWQPELQWRISDGFDITTGSELLAATTPVRAEITRPPEFGETGYSLTDLQKYSIDTTIRSKMIAPYVKVKKTWFDRFNIQLSARHTTITSSSRETMSATSPRVSSEWNVTDSTTFTAAWGRYLQLPDGSKWIREAGNPQLAFEESEHRIVGIRQKLHPLWNMQVEAYQKPLKNLAVTYDQNAPPDNYKSDGTGNTYGFDVLVKRDYADGKMGWLSYSYLRSNRTEKGVSFPFDGDQRHSFALMWSQPLPADWRRWNVGFKLRANSGRPYTPVVGRNGVCKTATSYTACADQQNAQSDPSFSHWTPTYGGINSARLPNFYQLDLRVDRQYLFDKWKMSVYMDILNALNIQNVASYDYGVNLEKIDNPRKVTSLGLLPSFGMELTF